jgi:SAM-dependent methyltransferase
MSKNIADVVYPERRFGGFSRVDGSISYYSRIQSLLRPGDVVLDLGCGRGAQATDPSPFRRKLRDLRGEGRKVIGIDVDRNAAVNPLLDEFRLIDDVNRWPIEDGSIDLIQSDFVLEHVPEPDSYFSEARRVLKPGGYFTLRTPNSFGYVALCSKLIPNRLHSKVLKRVQADREEEDVFPTVYRCNSAGKIRRALKRHGFDAVVYSVESEPGYMAFSRIAYRVMSKVHTVLPPLFRSTLQAFARKEGPN